MDYQMLEIITCVTSTAQTKESHYGIKNTRNNSKLVRWEGKNDET